MQIQKNKLNYKVLIIIVFSSLNIYAIQSKITDSKTEKCQSPTAIVNFLNSSTYQLNELQAQKDFDTLSAECKDQYRSKYPKKTDLSELEKSTTFQYSNCHFTCSTSEEVIQYFNCIDTHRKKLLDNDMTITDVLNNLKYTCGNYDSSKKSKSKTAIPDILEAKDKTEILKSSSCLAQTKDNKTSIYSAPPTYGLNFKGYLPRNSLMIVYPQRITNTTWVYYDIADASKPLSYYPMKTVLIKILDNGDGNFGQEFVDKYSWIKFDSLKLTGTDSSSCSFLIN